MSMLLGYYITAPALSVRMGEAAHSCLNTLLTLFQWNIADFGKKIKYKDNRCSRYSSFTQLAFSCPLKEGGERGKMASSLNITCLDMVVDPLCLHEVGLRTFFPSILEHVQLQ